MAIFLQRTSSLLRSIFLEVPPPREESHQVPSSQNAPALSHDEDFQRPKFVIRTSPHVVITKEHLTRLKAFQQQVSESYPGACSMVFFLEKTPSEILKFEKTAANVYELSIQEVERPLPSEKKTRFFDLLGHRTDLRLTDIIRGYEMAWKGFVTETQEGFVRQDHRIKGLKIYKDPHGQIIADIGVRVIGKGSCKYGKKIYKILPDGSLLPRLRYTATSKGDQGIFTSLIARELAIRDRLKGVPNILPLYESGAYIGKNSPSPKRRFETELCEGSVEGLLYYRSILPLKDKPQLTQKALFCLLESLRALEGVHSRGIVHRDFKPENIFYNGEKVFLADFGLSDDVGSSSKTLSGTPLFYAPEVILCTATTNSPARDMFAVGLSLLLIIKPELNERLLQIQGGILQRPGFTPLSKDEFLKKWEDLHQELKEASRGRECLEELILDLLSLDPSCRPTSTRTYSRLAAILQTRVAT